MYVFDQGKTQEICNNVNLKNGGILRITPHCYKNQNICYKAVDDYYSALEYVSD